MKGTISRCIGKSVLQMKELYKNNDVYFYNS